MASWVWPRPEKGDEIARTRIGLAAGAEYSVADADHPLHALQFFPRQRLVDALGSKVEVQAFRQQRQRIDFKRQLFDQRHLVLGFGLGRTGHRCRQIAQEHLVGIAAGLRGLVPDRVVALPGARQIARRREDDFAPASGEPLAAAAGAGLNNHGMALARARHRKRSARLEEFPVVIEPLDLVGVSEPA